MEWPQLAQSGQLSDIEDEIDGILKAERAKSAAGDESAVDDATLKVAAHRLESLIHDRRTLLAKRPAVAKASAVVCARGWSAQAASPPAAGRPS